MVPYEFILDLLYPLPILTKKMFGTEAIYVEDKIVLALRQRNDNPIDNGVWIATKVDYHNELKQLFPSLRNIRTYGIKAWLLLPETALDFEETANSIVEMIKSGNPLIGTVPKGRKKKP
ncbi:MAG: hypothetical protein AAGA43_03925 [Bacteroidota bacterium]